MNDFEDLVDRYIAIWNETDAERRRELIGRTWSGDAQYVDPMLEGEGHAGIDRIVTAVHERYPGHRFRRVGAVDNHHDRLRFAWEFAADGGDAIVVGTDFAVLGADRKLATVTGFFDRVATPPT
jgi:hypothetical protein